MDAPLLYDLPPAPQLPLRCVCGSLDWIAARPGEAAEERIQGNVCVLDPAPEVPVEVWCQVCWPWLRECRRQMAGKSRRRAARNRPRSENM